MTRRSGNPSDLTRVTGCPLSVESSGTLVAGRVAGKMIPFDGKLSLRGVVIWSIGILSVRHCATCKRHMRHSSQTVNRQASRNCRLDSNLGQLPELLCAAEDVLHERMVLAPGAEDPKGLVMAWVLKPDVTSTTTSCQDLAWTVTDASSSNPSGRPLRPGTGTILPIALLCIPFGP